MTGTRRPLLDRLLQEAAEEGVIECRECGYALEPDAECCACGWINPLVAKGFI